MFSKILIANRGEIACRIIKTARRMGIATVAVYSEADRNALHVAMADEAIGIGPAPASDSYLNIPRIVEACLATGAEAVHPGYGFLSERAAFPLALQAAGITFIGPHPRAIEAMGDKIESKKLAAAAGVSTVPGHLGLILDAEEAVRIAERIGYPVMIKASAGGGGKGMRIAQSRDDVAEGFARARSEAASAFGDDRVFIEALIANPRHIEIQVLADKLGNTVYLHERECSIQRRNQKVVEEAPSPLIDPETRRRMGEQAVALAKAVGYDSAGTVEFVVGQDKSFYFLEMNTRLQVEHPVTELITGIDLVEAMILIAAGEPLDIGQADVKLKGWAVESRIYAEDPARGFLPSTGRITMFEPPADGRREGVMLRTDAGVTAGGEISIHYDPMIAKLITHGETRASAVAAQAEALDRFVVDGVRHNIPFLQALMRMPRWRAGQLSTGFIAEEFGATYAPPSPEGEAARLFAAAALSIDQALRRRRGALAGRIRPEGPTVQEQDFCVLIDTIRLDATVTVLGDRLDARFTGDNGRLAVESRWVPSEAVWTGTIDGAPVALRARAVLNGYHLSHRGLAATVRVLSPRHAALAALMIERAEADASKALLCPMPGVVKAIDVSVGQRVKAGEPLCLVEAMKMENVLKAERDVTIKSIEAKAGDSLALDAPIMTFA